MINLKRKKMKMSVRLLLLVALSVVMTSCGGGSGLKSKVDLKILENSGEIQAISEAILKTMGDQATKADEVTIAVSNPADKGRTGDVYLMVIVDMQDPKKPTQLLRHLFLGEVGGWQPAQSVTVEARGSDEEKANYRLENELFDFKAIVESGALPKIIAEAYGRENDDPDSFTYRYVERINLACDGWVVSITGKLAANDQVIHKSYYYNPDGTPQ
jgi:hypothetical protein